MGHLHLVRRERLGCPYIPQIKPQHEIFKPLPQFVCRLFPWELRLELRIIMDTARHRMAEEEQPFLAGGNHRIFDRMPFFFHYRRLVASRHPLDG